MSASAGDMAPNTIKKDAEKMLFYTLSDLKKRGEGDLEPLKKLAFDPGKMIDRIDVPESVILNLLYSDELRSRV